MSTSFEKDFFETAGTYVHPTTILGPNVKLGTNVKVGPYSVIIGNITIHDNTNIHGYASIGMPAQDVNTKKPLGSVVIGKNCDIREFVTISSTKVASEQTTIGNNCYIMNFSHVAHDVTIEDNVTLINNVNIGGHVYVEHNVMLMANSAIHQFCRIGAYSALAPYSGMRQDLPPFSLYNGAPGRFAGLNVLALRRAGFTREEINAIKSLTKMFFQDKLPLEQIEQAIGPDACKYVTQFITFAKQSSRGISRKTINDG